MFKYFFAFLFTTAALFAADKPAEASVPAAPTKEEAVETSHTVTINGQPISYKAIAGTLVLKDDNGKEKASIFYTAYIKDGEEPGKRPITFCFNGGPGSASVWLHIGVFGPKRVDFNEEGPNTPPYGMVNNEFSILDLTDLVFIDPVSTGFSRPAQGEDVKQFHGVDEDVESVAKFIRLFTTRYGRWDSPKFIAGESYGTTRAAALANHLHSFHKMYVNGIILISSILNFQTLNDPSNGNDLPYILALPTYTATAWYHKKLKPEYQENLHKTLHAVEEFALSEYAQALFQGDRLDPEKRKEIITKLSEFTGLSPQFVDNANLRIYMSRFSKELLRNDKKTIGRFDTRFKGLDVVALGDSAETDPSADAIFGPFTGAFNEYLRADLGLKEDKEYNILVKVQPWNYGKATNSFLNVADDLREVMTSTPGLRVFVGNGYYDLATPYFASDYTFTHLGIDPSLQPYLTLKYYEAGHMMYVNPPSLKQMREDLAFYYKNPGPPPPNPIAR